MTCEDVNSTLHSEGKMEYNIARGLIEIASSLLNVSLVRDRMVCSEILESGGAELMGHVTFHANYATLQALEEYKKSDEGKWGTMLEMYTHGSYPET